MNKLFLKPADIIIILFAVILTIWLYRFFWFSNNELSNNEFGNKNTAHAQWLILQIADNPPQRYSLSEDRKINIPGIIGQSIIEIKNRKARFVHSSCRNKFCVLHGWISESDEISACVPNQISMSLQGSSHFDAISGH